MDIPFFIPELHCASMAAQADPSPYLEAASGTGLPVELCSIHRAMAGIVAQGDLPSPTLMVNTTQVCDSGFKSFGSLSDAYSCPDFFLDAPRLSNKEGVVYYKKELISLIRFLEEKTGKKLDMDQFREVLTLSRQAYEAFYEVGEMRKTIPTPLRARDALRNYTVFKHLAGTTIGVDYFETLRDEVKEQVGQGKGAVTDERHRIYWVLSPPNYALNIFDWMEDEHGAVIVMDVFNRLGQLEMDLSDPLEYLSLKSFKEILTESAGGPLELMVEDALRICRDYKVDGAVYLTQIGCKQSCGTIRSLQDALRNELDLPILIMDGDIIDPTILPVDQMKTKLEGFFEMLEDRA
jgi:benzoyl-CoA reductase/2-hydroxyglutaryl-CoA dehydratase subunit BcrC/BadD/HgdB